MKRGLFILTALTLLAGVSIFDGHGAEPKKVEELMREKLKHSQKVLEGVAVKDFKGIIKHSEELLLIVNEVEWKVLKTREYDNYSNEYRRNLQGLIKNAKDENLDACALSYVETTLTCVKCHKHVREVRMTALPRKPAANE